MNLQPRSLAHVKGYWTAYVVLFISLFLTIAGYLAHAKYIQTREQLRFTQAGAIALEELESSLNVFVTVMKGVRALFSASDSVTPEELANYFRVLKVLDLEANSGMDGMGVIWKVSPEERASHLAAMRRAYPDYQIHTRQTNRTLYPIIHFESLGPNPVKALGWDVSENPVRREALEIAETTGEPSATAKSRLFYTDGTVGPPGLVLYLPIFRSGVGTIHTAADVIGHIFAAFDAGKLGTNIFGSRNDVSALEIYDGNSLEKKDLIWDEDGIHHTELAYTPMLSSALEVMAFGRPWTFYHYTKQSFESSFDRRIPALMLALGTVASFLFFGLVFTQTKARRVAETYTESLQASQSALRAANNELARKVEEARQSSDQLSKSLSLQLATLDSTGDGILVVDRQARIVSFNKQYLQMWRIPEELTGVGDTAQLIDFVLEQVENPAEFKDRINQLNGNPEAEACDLILFKDGRIYERHSKPQRLNDQVIGRVMSFRDVTEQKRAAEQIAAEKERLSVTLHAISDGVVATDVQGGILLMNPVAEKMCGLELSSVAGMSIDKVFPLHDPQSKARLPGDLSGMANGEVPNALKPALLINALGEQILVRRRAAPTHDADGEIAGAVFVFRDVSQEQKAEQELLRASKLESIGLLAGGIAHDFNNVLTGIVGNLSLLREYPGLSAEVVDRLRLLERSAYKARQLTQQLLTFAKGGSPIKQTASIVEVIKESTEFALRGSNLRPEFDFAPDLAAVEIDTGQMSQVIQNLVINSKHAMPNGGVLRITGQNIVIDGSANLPLMKGNYVRVSLQDFGCGIRAEDIARIFDPYFTTKEKGSGLGLATAYSIMKRHDGLITAESEFGTGSTFHLYLPASNMPLPARPGDTAIRLRGTGAGRVLAMDDEPGIRTLLIAILKHFGYETTTVSDGAEAIREYKAARDQGRPYLAVIMDLTIPGGMGGKDTIRALREIDPGIRAIVCSGYSNDPVLAEYKKYGFIARVEKPYRMQELGRVLNSVLSPKFEA